MPRILLIAPWLPWPPHDGASIRILETLKYLSSRHEVSLLAGAQSRDESEKLGELSRICRKVYVERPPQGRLRQLSRMLGGVARGSSLIQGFYYCKRLADRLRRITSTETYDIVQIELSFFSQYVREIHAACNAKKVLATHNIETQRFEREIQLANLSTRRIVLQLDAWLYPRWEARALKQFDAALAVSENDCEWIEAHAPGCDVRLVPNGVDVEYFSPNRNASQCQDSVVFTGVMDYPPNVDAVCWFVKSIFPAIRRSNPNLAFKIVGARPTQEVRALASQPQVHVTGEVPDIRPFIDEAIACVVPLRSGGGTRLKILQAMAMAAPVISTRIGAEGLSVEHSHDILFAESADEFEVQIDQLVKDREYATRIGEAGHALVREKYAWSRCLRELDALYSHLLSDCRR